MRSQGGLERRVAVKLLRPELGLQSDAVRRLRDEGRVLALLNHPAILRVHDLAMLGGRVALITELVEGQDLSVCIEHKIPLRALLHVLAQVASALVAAGAARGPDGPLRLVHRDIKPSNIRVDRHGQTKLLDFGIARYDASDREVRTASDRVIGSMPFMAPERFVQQEVQPSSDVFSLGCVLYEGITGHRFFESCKAQKISSFSLYPERYEQVKQAQLARLQISAPLYSLLDKMLSYDPVARPTAAVAGGVLDDLADSQPGPTLRIWCRDRSWPTPPRIAGSYEGRSFVEEILQVSPASSTPERSPLATLIPVETEELVAKPQINRAPCETLASDGPVGLSPRAINPTAVAPVDQLNPSACDTLVPRQSDLSTVRLSSEDLFPNGRPAELGPLVEDAPTLPRWIVGLVVVGLLVVGVGALASGATVVLVLLARS